MNARAFRRIADRWECVVAGVVSLASCAVLAFLLGLLAGTQGRSSLGAASLGAAVPGNGGSTLCTVAAGAAPGAGGESQEARALAGVTGSGGGGQRRNEAAGRRPGALPDNARTPFVVVGVLLVWFLGLQVTLGPLFRPWYDPRCRGRCSGSF